MSFLRPRSNRIIIFVFFTLCALVILTSRLPEDHPARSGLNTALSYDLKLPKPWKSKSGDKTATQDSKKAAGAHIHHVGHPPIIGMDPATAHRYRDDGLLQINPRGPHPIYELVARAEKEWKAKNERASKTLNDAVAEYKRRYGRAPPLGFDKWFVTHLPNLALS